MVRAMRDNGRRIDFIGLTGTMISDGDASALASALNSLADRDATHASKESAQTLEILQIPLSAAARAEASERLGVSVPLSRVNRPALASSV